MTTTIYEVVTNILNLHSGSPEILKVLKIAPTGVHSIDKIPTGMCQSKIKQTLKCTERRTAGLPKILNFKKNAN